MNLKQKLIKDGKAQFFNVIYPQLKELVDPSQFEAVISGSVSFGYCDKHSDIDGKIFLSDKIFSDYNSNIDRIKGLESEKDNHRISYTITSLDEFCISDLLISDSTGKDTQNINKEDIQRVRGDAPAQ